MAGREEVIRNIESQLYADSRIDAKQISVELDDGVVVLSGKVQSLAALRAAEEAAAYVSGVKSVENRLKIWYPGDREIMTDTKIVENIKTALTLDRNVNPEYVEVTLQDGVVILSGSVDSYWKKVHCEEITANVRDVKQVINELTVVPYHLASDTEIAGEIRRALKRMDNVNLEYITIHVEDGMVLLTGKVPHWNAYYSVEFAARNTKGVRGIQNKLIIT